MSRMHSLFQMNSKTLLKPKNEKNTQNLPFTLGDVDCGPHLIHQCLCRPHSPPQTAAQSLHTSLHNYATKSPLVTISNPKTAHSMPILHPIYLTHPWNQPTYHPKWQPDPVSHFSTIHWSDTDSQTNRWSRQRRHHLYQYPTASIDLIVAMQLIITI